MKRRGNCGFAPPGADKAEPQFPQPRRFASPSFYGEERKRHCDKAGVRAYYGVGEASGSGVGSGRLVNIRFMSTCPSIPGTSPSCVYCQMLPA